MLTITYFSLKQAKNFNSSLQRESAFSQLRVAHGDRDPLPPQDSHPEPTEGAVSAEAHYKIIQRLFVATDPCKQLSGSAELHVFIHPKNPNNFFPLTMARDKAWAEAIVSSKILFLKY